MPTTDHDTIQQWVQERGGEPSCVRGVGGRGDVGLLRIDFPGYSGAQKLQHITWDEFFDQFEAQNLAFLYQDRARGGNLSRFCKLVDRNDTKKRDHGRSASSGGKSRSSSSASSKSNRSSRSKTAGRSTRATSGRHGR